MSDWQSELDHVVFKELDLFLQCPVPNPLCNLSSTLRSQR